jgi:hypothetical protein
MLLRPYRVVCEAHTPTALRYQSEWYPTLAEAQAAQTRHLTGPEPWDAVRVLPATPVPAASITGRQVVAVGAVRPRPGRPRGPE